MPTAQAILNIARMLDQTGGQNPRRHRPAVLAPPDQKKGKKPKLAKGILHYVRDGHGDLKLVVS